MSLPKSKDMPYHIGLVVRFYPSCRAKQIVAKNAGAQRKVYNMLVGTNNELYGLRQTSLFCAPIADRISYLESLLDKRYMKTALPFFMDKEVDSCTLDFGYRNYYTAWKNFSERPECGKPVFHKKTRSLSYQTSNHYKTGDIDINDGSCRFVGKTKFRIPIIGEVRIKGSHKMINRILEHPGQSRITTVKVSKDATDRYYLSIQVASDTPFFLPLPKTGSSAGYDVNLSNLCTGSDGSVTDNRKCRRQGQKKLAKLQKRAARKKVRALRDGRPLQNAKNYQAAQKKVAEQYRHMAASNDEYLENVTKHIIENQDAVFVEHLQVRNMKKNHKLAFSISDVSWFSFAEKLQRKAESYGKTFRKVPARNTTQKCSYCGYVCKGDTKVELGVSAWVCPQCGTIHDRDYNSSCNILAAGLEVLREEQNSPGMTTHQDNRALIAGPLHAGETVCKSGVSA